MAKKIEFKIVVKYSSEKLNREVLSNHICDIIKENELKKGDSNEYETEENSSVA